MLNKKLAVVIVAAFTLIMMLGACGSKSTQNTAASSEIAAQELVVHAKNWEYDKDVYTVKKGEPVKITLESKNVHGLQIQNMDVKLTPGDSTIVTFDNAGEYQMFCNIPCGTGHHEMKATLKVE